MCLERADLGAARGLKCIGGAAFSYCSVLEEVLLNEGLEKIGEECFAESGLKRVSIPSSVKFVHRSAFARSSLTQVRFRGIPENGPHCGPKPHSGHSSGDTKGSHLESEHRLVVGEDVFSDCMSLRQVVFEPDSAV